jgi:hypothetical protein
MHSIRLSLCAISVFPLALLASCGSSSEEPAPAAVKRVFLTSVRYDGNRGGLTGADANCATAATSAALGGTWKAFLSTSAVNAIDRITEVGPWYRVDGTTKVFNNKTSMTIDALASITDENGGAGITHVWTGTAQNGTAATNHCTDWTDGTGGSNGEVGLSTGVAGDAAVGNWADAAQTAACNGARHLYCIEQ